MTEVLLLHHALGRTAGVHSFADRLTRGGHTVHVPDLYDGRVFDTVDAGVAHAQQLGALVEERALAAARDLPAEVVHLGWSLGVMSAQRFAQTRAGARGAVLLEGFAPPDFFGPWPSGLRAQIHGMIDDPWFAEDLDAARECSDRLPEVELITYPGSHHLFADESTPSHDASAARELEDRVLAFLASLG